MLHVNGGHPTTATIVPSSSVPAFWDGGMREDTIHAESQYAFKLLCGGLPYARPMMKTTFAHVVICNTYCSSFSLWLWRAQTEYRWISLTDGSLSAFGVPAKC